MEEKHSSLAVPVAIIVSILILAGAFYYQSQNPGPSTKELEALPTDISQLLPVVEGVDLTKFHPVDNTDKIRGSISAPIKIVVYTDLECPACKIFHTELKKLETTYVETGKIAIILRDFPLDYHTKSQTEFLAAECVNEIGGNEKFWQFVDKIFEITPSNDGLDLTKLGETAQALGLDIKTFDVCMIAQKYANKIQRSVDEATAIGAKASSFGTPFFVLVTPDQNIPVFGGIPANHLSTVLDLLLKPVLIESSTPAITPTASTTIQ